MQKTKAQKFLLGGATVLYKPDPEASFCGVIMVDDQVTHKLVEPVPPHTAQVRLDQLKFEAQQGGELASDVSGKIIMTPQGRELVAVEGEFGAVPIERVIKSNFSPDDESEEFREYACG